MQVPICEIYAAVQAEGLHKTPAVFVRFHGCTLRCQFDRKGCDSSYAVTGDEFTRMSCEDVADKVASYNIPHIVFTGGEPLLYQAEILEILDNLPVKINTEFFVELETNGTLELDDYCLKYKIDQFNVSVKLSSSNQKEGYDEKRVNPDAIRSFPTDSIFKFVVKDESDITEIKGIIECNPAMRVFLMPEGDTRKKILKNTPLVMEMCMKYGYGFTNRDHILAYDNKRGV